MTFKCPFCEKVYLSLNEYGDHYIEIHFVTDKINTTCPICVVQTRDIISHLKIVHANYCQLCLKEHNSSKNQDHAICVYILSRAMKASLLVQMLSQLNS